jgi:hypothetical protein
LSNRKKPITNNNGVILQSTIAGHVIMVDPQVISQIIGVLVLQISASPLAPLDELKEFFHAVPQGEERASTIMIGALSPPHHKLAKIIQHNLWLIVSRSDLILKRGSILVCHLPDIAVERV